MFLFFFNLLQDCIASLIVARSIKTMLYLLNVLNLLLVASFKLTAPIEHRIVNHSRFSTSNECVALVHLHLQGIYYFVIIFCLDSRRSSECVTLSKRTRQSDYNFIH